MIFQIMVDHVRRLKRIRMLVLFTVACLFMGSAAAEHPAAIATASKHATKAGMEILNKGGNAFDAAVAVAAVLAVVEPYGSGLGGGGYWLMHHAKTDSTFVIDSREIAPKKATEKMFLNDKGEPIPGASFDGAYAAAIPGEPAAMTYIAKNYGLLPLSDTLAPAIAYAKTGFLVDEYFQNIIEKNLERLQTSASTAHVFLENNTLPPVGYRIVQPDLAATLEVIASKGHAGFYQGALAKQLVNAVDEAGGVWQLSDLADYTISIKKPLVSQYHDITVSTVPLSSGGGITLINMLNMLSAFDFKQYSPQQTMQIVIEAMRRAYFDRVKYLGDNEDTNRLTKQLISKTHANAWRSTINLDKATPSDTLSTNHPVIDIKTDGNTTHFSILDREGNAVAATLSLNYYFGSFFIPPGTGILLNNHMDDFSIKPGVANVYGLVGSQANAIEPGKRPLSSIAPTFLQTKNKMVIIGTPGGSRIPTMLLLAILDFAKGHDVTAMVNMPRYHHQYLPDEVQFEQGGLTDAQQKYLKAKGYTLQEVERSYGDMQVIIWDHSTNQVTAASDPRGDGQAVVGRVRVVTH